MRLYRMAMVHLGNQILSIRIVRLSNGCRQLAQSLHPEYLTRNRLPHRMKSIGGRRKWHFFYLPQGICILRVS